MSYISVDYDEGLRQGARLRELSRVCAGLKACGAEEAELDRLACELEAIGADITAECQRLLDIEKTMFSAHRGGGNAYV